MRKVVKNVYSTNQVLSELAKGELGVYTAYNTGGTWTSGTEILENSWGDATNRVVLPYLTVVFGYQSSDTQLAYDWFVFRNTADATVDFSTGDTLEGYMKNKKILDRGFIVQGWIGATDMKITKRTYFNVGLEPGEFLILMIVPRVSSSAGSVAKFYKHELRSVSISTGT